MPDTHERPKMIFGECDNCGKKRLLRQSNSYGIETCGCTKCHGGDLSDDEAELSEEMISLIHEHMPHDEGMRLLAVFAAYVEAVLT